MARKKRATRKRTVLSNPLLPVLRCLPVQRVSAHQQHDKEQGGGRRLSGTQNRASKRRPRRHEEIVNDRGMNNKRRANV